ncbi:URC4/urg3 family protein [Aquabacterium sp. J223]|uniref:URC4/urg3 family protein n=1 Tax=Aquabacterium sp. J223 TaxID=2898431 RepID=UPI0021AD8B42|nr:URC4/urg3 family protein [Aquabacterium sp. J223]UUX94194.1 URC4/urg3 family protein [Aquabacterium sp. J223]
MTAEALLTAQAVRAHAEQVLAAVQAGGSRHWAWDGSRLEATADFVADTIRQRYPSLQVPFHARWRHFEAGGTDRWAALSERHGLQGDAMRAERARVRIDLVIPSVLLDAGAGADWRYREDDGGVLARSEGLGVASLALFAAGTLSADPRQPLRADATALQAVTPDAIGRAFQVGPDNPLVGLDGRAALLARLGTVAAAAPAVFGTPARLGHLFDHLAARAVDGRVDAGDVLSTLLHALGPVWPSRHALQGVPLGDCWPCELTGDGWLPLHKLSQWLTYSLLEPLADGGLQVTGLDALTGLPEYRNGGLLIDLGLLRPRDPGFLAGTWRVDTPAVVEWRGLTVAALDRLAVMVRGRLGLSAADFPLACVLEGGTWAAGRRIAAERRPGGGPPFAIHSDGTVF